MGLKEFLVTVKDSLADLPTRKKVHLVIGNESCDLDSVVSAITYAYFLHQVGVDVLVFLSWSGDPRLVGLIGSFRYSRVHGTFCTTIDRSIRVSSLFRPVLRYDRRIFSYFLNTGVAILIPERSRVDPRDGLRVFLYKASPQQGDLRFLGLPSGRGADGGARTRNRRVPTDLRADSQATVPPTPQGWT
ncbi:protein prune homolog-like protein [Plakobranchus ocellatus]|uniref:Protein prune homolog-like protein n=1 Tax=Plakobranchus ocellatus TaxID=259542 RepID=A0AAV4DU61_9GAST|nr:protein prune homolog-like protein [Plakobranchus ocellatus]